MITIELTGGLGNQLFQYAFGKSLAIEKNIPFILDISSYEFQNLRKYGLDNYLIKDLKLKGIYKMSFKDRIVNFFFKKKTYLEPYFSFDKNVYDLKYHNITFKGYWQSEKYFNKIRTILLNDLRQLVNVSSETKKWLELINQNYNIVSVHVRRGDYILNDSTNKYHGTCNIDYYMKAINIIKNKNKDAIFLFFSDDINFVKETYSDIENVKFIDDIKNDYEELFLMSNCNHNIIANSSFSWWGAWLNDFKDKTVVAPQKWFENEEMQAQTNDLLPDTWIKI